MNATSSDVVIANIRSSDQMEELEKRFLEKLQECAGICGNVALQRYLNIDKELYWQLRDRLADKGLIRKGKGKGGSVVLVNEGLGSEKAAAGDPHNEENASGREADLYESLAKCLKEQWAKDNRFSNFWVEVTAAQGGRQTGGRWTRPDITCVGVKVPTFFPGKSLDVTTFEVKVDGKLDVTAVYEALAHRRGALRSYLLIKISKDQDSEEQIAEICTEARKYGVGVVTFTEAEDYSTWDEHLAALVSDTEPDKVSDFIAVQISDAGKQEISKWVR